MGIYYLNRGNGKDQMILGFDFGTKYIGVAVGQTATNTSRALTCLKVNNNQIDWTKIDELVSYWQPKQLIVGIPINLKQPNQLIFNKCLAFFNKLQKRYNLPTHKVDEDLSTWEAKKNLSLLKGNSFSKEELLKINSHAASILVKQWLDESNNKL
jgi:putative holliday junction resolvase